MFEDMTGGTETGEGDLSAPARKELPRTLQLVLLFAFTLAVLPFQAEAQQDGPAPAVEWGAAYTSELWGNVSGGRERGVRFMDNVDLTAELDLDEMLGWRGGSVFLYGLGNQGGSISELAGDYQGISNIEAETSWRLFEAWVEKVIPGTGISLLGGLYDVNSEFNMLPSAQLFINSSHGIGAAMGTSGRAGPSIFPITSLGARLKMKLAPGLYLQGAAVDGIPSDPGSTGGTRIYLRKEDGLLVTGEITYLAGGAAKGRRALPMLRRNDEPEAPARIAVGGWHYTRQSRSFAEAGEEGRQRGLYAIAEARLSGEGGHPGRGLSLFGRMELANAEFTPVTAYFGGGLVYGGLFREGGKDRAGLAVAHAVRSPDYQVDYQGGGGFTGAGAETNLELTYLAVLNGHLQMQFSSQYIRNPGWLRAVGDAWVNGLRVIAEL